MNAFNNLKVGNKIIIGYFAVLFLMGSMATVLLFSLNNLVNNFTFLIEHDLPVLSNAHQLAKLMVDMETGERGFLITGKDEFLEPYHNGLAKFDTLLEMEKELVSDNLPQVAILEKIGHLHDKWIQVAGEPEIAKRREANKATVNAEHLQEILRAGVGKGILDELRGVVDQLETYSTSKGDLESVILTIKIIKDMLDQETGQRGFIITGEDSFLEPYRNGQAQLATNIAMLRPRLEGDPDRLVLLNQIESLSAKWLEKAAKPEIEARREMNANQVTIADVSALIQVGTGKDILDTMRIQFDTFIQNENKLNAMRSQEAKQKFMQIRILILTLLLGSIIIGLILGIFIPRSITVPLQKITEMANQMAAGNLSQTMLAKSHDDINTIIIRQDEMGDIGRAFNTVINYFKAVIADIVQVSQGLATGHLRVVPQAEYRGDFVQIKTALTTALSDLGKVIEDIVQVSQGLAEASQNVTPQAEYQGDFLQIKNALETAAFKLSEIMNQNATQDWLKTGQAQLNELMSGEQNLMKLAKNIITGLTTYIEAQVGLFYLLKEAQGSHQEPYLQLLTSYAYVTDNKRPHQFSLGEGLIGQAALEGKTLSLTQTPEECYHIIRSGLTNALPCYTLILPFLYENTVKGIIEIGFSEAVTDIQREFLERIMPNIGIAINMVESRSQLQTLLETSQRQTEELQSQSEELQSQQEEMQQVNAQLQNQRGELEAKQAELQQRNEELQTQSEELQSQSEELQTQQEELKQTNEALEERTKDLEQQKAEIQHKNLVLEQTQLEMEKARTAIETKAQELELASQYKSEFLANMSHELRTPLNSLLILAQLLSENKAGNLADKQVEYAKTIHSAGTDLLTLINEILDLSKVEAGKIEVQLEDVSLSDLVEMLEQKFRVMASEKGLAFHITLANDLPPLLQTDGQRLKQIINNLLSNAFKFTTQGEIKLELQHPSSLPPLGAGVGGNLLEPAKTIAISVTDTGIGIPSAKQQVIFEAFQQADGSTSRSYGGTGLGLSISRQLARLLGGELQLHSEEGKGSTFTLYLPQKPIESNHQDFSQQVVSQTDSEENKQVVSQNIVAQTPLKDDREKLNPNDKTILIIEDDQKFAKILMELAQGKHFKCIIAEDGRTGLQLAEEYKPNAIILDVTLPSLDGWTVMDKLKDNPDTRHIPVHFISAADQSRDASKMGAIGYLHKPVNMEQLGWAFKKIERFITKTVKNLLVVVDSEIHQQQILELVEGADIQTTLTKTMVSAIQNLESAEFDCMILDMDVEQQTGSQLLEKMQQAEGLCQTPVIVYAERELTSEEEALLLRCADSLTIKAVRSEERLLDEATLFLHQIEAKLSTDKRNMLRMVHDKEAILANKKVLIVDDDARNTFALATVLEEKNMEVLAGNNGNEALELLEEHPDIAIILMDIMMPEMDGYEATRQIRNQLQFRKLPIIALTAKAMKGDKSKCIEAGANDYLSKPVDTDKLLSLMRVWLYR